MSDMDPNALLGAGGGGAGLISALVQWLRGRDRDEREALMAVALAKAESKAEAAHSRLDELLDRVERLENGRPPPEVRRRRRTKP